MISKNKEKIKEITNKIVGEFQPEKIILFGSYAWGEPNQDSDLDLFIIKNTNEERRDRQLKVRRLFLNFDMPADVLVYTPQEIKNRIDKGDFFIIDIINKGKVLYSSRTKSRTR